MGCFRVGDTECGRHRCDLLKKVAIILITFTIVWSQVKQQEGTQAGQSTENWIKDLLNMSMVTAAMKLKEACSLEEKL